MSTQIPLPFELLEPLSFSSFFPGDNQQLLHDLKKFIINASQETFIYLWGSAGVGKTHLLQAVGNYALEKKVNAIYFDMLTLLKDPANYDYLSGLEQIKLLCLDNINVLENNLLLQEKLFYLFNNIRARNHRLIVSANSSPGNLSFSLADLKSRMSWGTAYHIYELNEQQKLVALIFRANQIGLELKPEVAKFLLVRVKRDLGELLAILKKLDRASLAAKRKLTVPFIKEILGI